MIRHAGVVPPLPPGPITSCVPPFSRGLHRLLSGPRAPIGTSAAATPQALPGPCTAPTPLGPLGPCALYSPLRPHTSNSAPGPCTPAGSPSACAPYTPHGPRGTPGPHPLPSAPGPYGARSPPIPRPPPTLRPPPMMAEYGWDLTDTTVKKARRELNEVPERRQVALEAVREQMITRPDINFLRTDDSFILRFLRARKFHAYEAFRLYARYFEYRQQNPNLFKKFHAAETNIKNALLDGFPGVLKQTDHYGRKVLVLFSANWNNERYGLASIYRALLLTLEKLISDEETQINGFVIIVDWSQFSFKQSTWINPKILKLMIEGLQDCFPARFGTIHFVNQPWYVEAVFKVMKPFIKEKTREKIFMHGNNMGTLHQYLHEDILPAELGGSGPPYQLQSWARQLIGDETFSFGDKQIYWPDHCTGIKTRSETFPIDHYTTEVKTEPTRRTQLDEEFFLID